MKKILFILLVVYTTVYPVIAQIGSNPIISRGKTVYTSSGNVTYLVDNKFNSSKWPISNGSWIAIQLVAGPTKVFVNWNNSDYHWAYELIPSKCAQSGSFPIDYNILTSSNSTNGVDGQWEIADSIRNNIVTARGHLIEFAGASWVKMQILKGGGQMDEFEVFDASNGDEDVWFFAGTSISANTFKGTPPAQNFADLVTQKFSGYNPVMIRGGIGCISSTDLVNNLPKYLKIAGNAHYWAIEMGTNDAWGGSNGNAAIFKSNLQKVIDSCKARGIEPIIARVLATNPARSGGWQIHPDFQKAVDDLTTKNNLIAGPDLFTWFLANPGDLNTDGVHPNGAGAASIQRLWAQKMDSLYGGCIATDIVPYIKVNSKDSTLTASISLSSGDTLTLIPQVTGSGSWSWSGPNGFSSSSRKVVMNDVWLNQTGNYIVSFTNSDACISNYTFKAEVKRCVAQEIIPNLHIKGIDSIFLGSAKYSVGDTLTFSPESSEGGKWSWVGPNGFSSETREVTLNNTQLNQGGSYIVTYINDDSCMSKSTFKISINNAAAIKPLKRYTDNGFIFPNPADGGNFKVTLSNISAGARIYIYTVEGKLVYNSILTANETEVKAELSTGVYTIKIINGSDILNQNLIVN